MTAILAIFCKEKSRRLGKVNKCNNIKLTIVKIRQTRKMNAD